MRLQVLADPTHGGPDQLDARVISAELATSAPGRVVGRTREVMPGPHKIIRNLSLDFATVLSD